jgi:hypothetical protein
MCLCGQRICAHVNKIMYLYGEFPTRAIDLCSFYTRILQCLEVAYSTEANVRVRVQVHVCFRPRDNLVLY